ncbi:1-deoxy-D-xylulose-5-phosphate reductoisomerase [Helicobacter didelphidarum]|uniref:1-deoxy-D-xylulose 5-phosphate reductoisomerase n=1 Tax=Helicobacter didelphidarum TaxID=2040648 RepID=A0A3D8ILH8_9HELI|nr:1-deoxy-D-xylulose-5-phosphate reductoisomerase [Helicobacter didelphidarum]RDU65860.1 1-deoxy-D-xylulose-5-phosphate reductoisomerase [Helicobacter didelphidarum]
MVILGSTGSIGVNALKVAKQFAINIEALSCGNNIKLLNEQIKTFHPKFVGINDESALHLLQPFDSKVFVGQEGIIKMLQQCQSHKVLNAVVGYAGLQFSLNALDLGKNLILANKESLVIAGGLLREKILQDFVPQSINHNSKKHNTTFQDSLSHDCWDTLLLQRIFPIDSEHFSLYALLHNNMVHDSLDSLYHNKNITRNNGITNKNKNKISRDLRHSFKKFYQLYITASGGALRDVPLERIPHAMLNDVLKHPTWNMGKKITIDSASLVNKLYETLEAFWLFNTTKIHALIERSSIVHALVESNDGSLDAYISYADMCLPIAYGLDTKKAKEHFNIQKIGIKELCGIQFQEIDTNRYPLWRYKNLLLEKPHLGIVLNTSNEILQDLFLNAKIPFGAFIEVIPQALLYFEQEIYPQTLNDILCFRQEIIKYTNALLKKYQ